MITLPNQIHNNNRSRSKNDGGIKIGCCRICTCLRFDFLYSKHGLLKLFEVILGSVCQSLLMGYGLTSASDIGEAFHSCLTTTSACLTTTTVLFICYFISFRTFHLIRQSLFEVIFNVMACFLYSSSTAYMTFILYFWLYPKFLLLRGDMTYPAMKAVVYIGGILSLIYFIDAVLSYRSYRGYK